MQMFYASELLSHKNKTELSLLYYLSTAGSLKRVSRKDILNLNFNKLLDEITHPKMPFALRLYSYLLRGLVKVWILKINFYKSKMKRLMINRKASVSLRKEALGRAKDKNVNLEINEGIISDIECSEASSNIFRNNIIDSYSSVIHQGYDYDIMDGAEDYTGINFMAAGQDDSKKRSKVFFKIDSKTVLDSDQILEQKYESPKIRLPCLQESFVVAKFSNIKPEAPLKEDKGATLDLGFDNFSIEDPRLSSSLSHEREYSKIMKFHREEAEQDSQALWFYNVLVRASKGEVKVFQTEPFGKLIFE